MKLFILWQIALVSLFITTSVFSADLDGAAIMAESVLRHEHTPFLYEEQTIILMDAKNNKDVRKARQFVRATGENSYHYLIVFDKPSTIRGVAFLVNDQHQTFMHLPAHPQKMFNITQDGSRNYLMGTDFTMEDLLIEDLKLFSYQRQPDQKINKIDYYVVDALPKIQAGKHITGYRFRRLFLRQDNFFTVQTDYYDRRGRFQKRLNYHDLRLVEGQMWRGNLILMDNKQDHHKTLIKVTRRVLSQEWVPAELFTLEGIMAHKHMTSTQLNTIKYKSTQNNQAKQPIN